jgi:molecular chaperone DnaJ
VLSDPARRKEYDEARQLFANGFRPGGGGGFPGGGGATSFDLGDLFGGAATGAAGGLGDLLGGLFGGGGGGRGAQGRRGGRSAHGADVETEVRIDFAEAVLGATVPLRLSAPTTCGTCAGSGARPGTAPRTCPTCSGTGMSSRSQGAFAFSEPCLDCHGSGRLVDDPCPECGGRGVSTRTRTLTARIPPGVSEGQRIRLAGQGEPGSGGAAAGDLYVLVHVNPHPVFGRSETDAHDLTLNVPVTFPELTLGTTLSVPTLDGKVSLKVPPGSQPGRTLRVRGKGGPRRDGRVGDLLVTLKLAVPAKLNGAAKEALEAYAAATAGDDPRSDLMSAARTTRESTL